MHLAVTALCLTLAPALARASASCGLANISISVENEECGGCVTFNTTSCAGLCKTQDSVYRSSLGSYTQQACNFRDVVYETVHLPGCSNGMGLHFTYPVALSCECSKCNTDSTYCGPLNTEVSGCLTH